MTKKLGILTGLAALVAILTLTFTGSALAAPPSPNYGFGFMDRVTLQRVATALGTSTDEVVTQLQQGKTLLQIAQARNVTGQTLTDTLLAPIKDQLSLQVKYGYLTQEQADTRLQNEQTRVNDLINTAPSSNGGNGYGPYGGGMMGGSGGMMGPGGWGGFAGMMEGFGGMMGSFGNMMSGFGGMMGGLGGRGMMGR